MPSRMRRRLSFFHRAPRCQNATENIHSSHIDIPGPRAVSGTGDLGVGAENRTKNGTKTPNIGYLDRRTEKGGEETREAEGDEKSREGGRVKIRSEQLDRRWAGCLNDMADGMRSCWPIRKMHACPSGFKSSPKREKRET